ncbi:MAG: hypothetical protein IJY62_00640 [Clostridia bacterium]|nr:hypothetical protein [Clostridia bacterium]
MLLYLTVITIATVVIAVLNVFFVAPALGRGAPFTVFATVASVVLVILIDGVTAWLVNRLPEKPFDHKKKFFTVSAKEKKFYEKLGIRKWKDRIPELGALGGFRKDKVAEPTNNEYVGRFLLEICYGQFVHILSMISGFLVMLIFMEFALTVGLPVAIVNLILNLPSICILRYNSYKLEVLYKSNEKKAARARVQKAMEEAAATDASDMEKGK